MRNRATNSLRVRCFRRRRHAGEEACSCRVHVQLPDQRTAPHTTTPSVVRAACAPDTDWVVVTNGDNTYHSETFASLGDKTSADAVAWDFYSRYQRPTGAPCERFQARS